MGLFLFCYKKMNDKEVKAFYNSGAWKEKRIRILCRDNYECVHCRERLLTAAKEGRRLYSDDARIRRAEEVHHVKELKLFPELCLDDDNLVSLCVKCHNKIHGRFQKGSARRKKLIADECW